MPDTLAVKLELYEGPLELLLHLIKKNEVDINDLPLALITAQYLEYLEAMEGLNLAAASEFLLMAATLIHLKSAAVLPWPQTGEEAPEEEQRRLLIEPLLEYAEAKALAEALAARPQLGRDIFSRSYRENWPGSPQTAEAGLGSPLEASVLKLVEAFKKLAGRQAAPGGIILRAETKTIGERLREAREMLIALKKLSFVDFCRGDQNRADLILSFLAVLELAKAGFLICRQTAADADLWLLLAGAEDGAA